MSNHLSDSASPYLLQHAHNPVEWYPWGEEALARARAEDKPIFLSIGYAACHWCHVMAHESFEDPEVAAIMNRYYVNIKVDREERPDLDSIYMAAVVALAGQGGWPMSLFLTPDLQPFYGGTYFPPKDRHGLPAFTQVLLAIADYWQNKRTEVIHSGQQITLHLQDQTSGAAVGVFTPDLLATASQALISAYDWQFGGWGAAPKFPQPMALEFLLRRHLAGDADALEPALHALRLMARGGMYDVVGGGFARYSTDQAWRVPHFEKMLYDNAQLTRGYLHAWQITREPGFRQVVEETLSFVSREMLSPTGGFYSSLDADSEGEEGRFYVWTLDEIRGALGGRDELFEAAYGLTAAGNWEGRTVLQRALDDAALAVRFGLPVEEVYARLQAGHARLLALRNTRVRPATDDKVLASWNGLMLCAFAEAARVLSDARYLRIAANNANFMLTSLRPGGHLRRAWRRGQVSSGVYLEDYASLILGLLELYQTDFNNRWYTEASGLAEEMLQKFIDPGGGFYDTPSDAEIVLTRPKDLNDNATPSGNALAAEALFKLAAFTGNTAWQQQAEKMLGLVADLAPRYPTAFGRWLCAADFNFHQVRQVAVVGDLLDIRTQALLAEILNAYDPNLVVAASPYPAPDGSPALMTGRPMLEDKPTVYVCEGFVCRQPVTGVDELHVLLS
jgi:uncharacterized protein YyaL (SSP411 family)